MASDTPYQAPAASTEPSEPAVRGYGQTLMDLFIAPGDAFRDLVKKPRILVVLLLLMALNIVLIGVWLSKVDMYEMVRAQSEMAGRPAPPRDALPIGAIKAFTWCVTLVAPLLFNVIVAGVFLLIFNFMLGAQAKFKTVLSVLLHAGFTVSVVSIPITLLVYALKGDWNLSPDQILQASPAAFLDRAATSKVLYALAGKFDLFMIWLAALYSIGLGRATGRSTGSAASVIVTLWVILALLHIGWLAITG